MSLQWVINLKISNSAQYRPLDAIAYMTMLDNPQEYKLYGMNLVGLFYDDPMVLNYILHHVDVDINYTDGYNRTPLYFAIRNQKDTAISLYKYGANINSEQLNGLTPITSLILNYLLLGQAQTLEFIQKIIPLVDILYQNKYGDSVLHYLQFTPPYAIERGITIAELLINNGAIIDLENNEGLTINDILGYRSDLESLTSYLRSF